jgi:hypothetical protein
LSLRRRLVAATIAGLLFGAAMVALFSQNHAAQVVRAKAVQVMNVETLGRPAPALKREIASSSGNSGEETSTPEETPAFSCLSYLHDQIEDYDLFMRRLESHVGSQVGSWYFYHDEDLSKVQESSASGLFLLGLANAGLLEGSPAQPDIPRAMENLKAAHELDPKNSAPLIFLAYLADQRDDPETAKKYRAQITSASHFESYILPLANAVYDTIESPSDYMNTVQVWSGASIPNYTVLSKYLKEQKLAKVADQMVNAQNFEGEADLDFFFIEGAIGISVIKKLQPERTESLPSMQEVMKRLVASRPPIIWDEMNEKDCELSRLDSDIARLHERRRDRRPPAQTKSV